MPTPKSSPSATTCSTPSASRTASPSKSTPSATPKPAPPTAPPSSPTSKPTPPSLSAESRDRLARNPLRILDSKDENDRKLVAGAPTVHASLTPAAQAHYDDLRRYLDAFEIPFTENPRIVRGLDYYSHTAFEFVTSHLGAQGTVLAGGRYDGLVQAMGGPPTPAVGWAGGIERLAMLLNDPPAPERLVAVIPANDALMEAAIPALQRIRAAGIRAEMAYRGNLKRRMERANKAGAWAAIIIGEKEAAAGHATFKNLETGEQKTMPFDQVMQQLMESDPDLGDLAGELAGLLGFERPGDDSPNDP